MSTTWSHLRADLASWLGLGRRMPGGDAARRELGLRGERAAASYLKRRGYRVVQRNVRVAIGEADLVCLGPDRATVVLVEVKARTLGPDGSAPFHAPEASITTHKQRKLSAIGRWLARANNWSDRPVRVDSVAVEWPATGGKPVVRHHTGLATIHN